MMCYAAISVRIYIGGGVMILQSFRRQRNCYALLFMFGIAGALGTAFWQIPKAVVAFGVVSTIALVFLVRKNRLLHDAALIWDNRILAVPSAFFSASNAEKQNRLEETVISTFGALIGTKIYRWGLDGVHGVRLSGIEIDRQRIILTFGDAARTMRIELLHGMTEPKEILSVKQKFNHETGITASINDWQTTKTKMMEETQ